MPEEREEEKIWSKEYRENKDTDEKESKGFKEFKMQDEEDEPIKKHQEEPVKKHPEEHLKKHHSHHHESHEHHKGKKKKEMKVNNWAIVSGVLAVLFVISIYTAGFSFGNDGDSLTKEDASQKALNFVNEELLQGQTAATLKEVTEEAGLYNLKLNVAGQEVDSYVTKDGKLFFPQAIEVDAEIPIAPPSAQQQQAPPEVVKSDKPKVELFVMSHCPYGTQAEKGMIPVAEELGDKIDFEIKFVYYAMHGKMELDEQANQVCIQDEQNDKFNAYLKCFLDEGDGEKCLTNVGVDKAKMEACVARLDTEFKITGNFEDQASWLSGRFPLFDVHKAENELYGIRGSPGLVVNGEMVSSGRSPNDYLATICAAFNDAPEECEVSLSTETYSPGFGYEVGANTAASCG